MFLLLLILIFSASFLAVQLLDENLNGYGKSAAPLQYTLSIGLGLGMASCSYFVCLLLFKYKNTTSEIAEVLFYFILVACFLFYKKHTKNKDNYTNNIPFALETNKILLGGFAIVVLVSISYFLILSIKNIHGGWDAWAIWNMRARFLLRDGEHWTKALSAIYNWSHPDYPLLIPANISRIWNYIGNDTVIVPIAVSAVFTFLTISLLVSALACIRSLSIGLLAGIVLMGMFRFIRQGAMQCADIPFSFYLLAVIVLFYLYEKTCEKNRKLLFLAGAMAGFAAWTKNEGLLLLLSVFIAHVIVTVPVKGFKTYTKELTAFLAGLLPLILIIAYFKTQLVPPNDLIAGQTGHSAIDRLTDYSRIMVISKSFWNEFFGIVKGRIIIFPLLIFMLGFKHSKEFKRSHYLASSVLFFMLVGYFTVYIFTPHDLKWHLETSLKRLFLHLLPSAIFIFFTMLKAPEEIAKTKLNLSLEQEPINSSEKAAA